MEKYFSTDKIQRVILEFTTRCNLRCAYCEKSQPDASAGIDLPEDLLNKIISFIIDQKIGYVCVNGNGETTLYKNWDLHCDRLLDSGCKLGIITNFSKKFSEKEIQTLRKFSCIEISCDTADPKLFTELRRGATLPGIIYNMHRIQNAARSLDLPAPVFSWSCLLSDQNVFKLEDYFILGVENGVRSFNICNLVKYPDVFERLPIRHITEMPDDKFREAALIFDTLINMLRENKIEVRIPPALSSAIFSKYSQIKNADTSGTFTLSNHSYYSSERPETSTRDCTEPWSSLFFRADNTIVPCCVIDKVNTLDPSSELLHIINSKEIQSLRQELFNGRLDQFCEHCPNAGWTTIDSFKKKITDTFGA